MSTIPKYRSKSFAYDNRRSCPWRSIEKGLNIEGLCDNHHCQAYGQMVIINLGFGEFDHGRIILQRKNECPMCKNIIHPCKYGLTKCQWWYVNHYDTNAFPLNIVNDTYELNDLKCEYTMMEIMPLTRNSLIDKRSQEITCPICLINVENNNEIMKLECSHTFHRVCIDSWLQSNQIMANKCPICRDYIVKRK